MDAGRDPDALEFTVADPAVLGPDGFDVARRYEDLGAHRILVPPPTFDALEIGPALMNVCELIDFAMEGMTMTGDRETLKKELLTAVEACSTDTRGIRGGVRGGALPSPSGPSRPCTQRSCSASAGPKSWGASRPIPFSNSKSWPHWRAADTSAGWNVAVGSTHTAMIGAYVSQEAADGDLRRRGRCGRRGSSSRRSGTRAV